MKCPEYHTYYGCIMIRKHKLDKRINASHSKPFLQQGKLKELNKYIKLNLLDQLQFKYNCPTPHYNLRRKRD